jgi:hypothetical protein
VPSVSRTTPNSPAKVKSPSIIDQIQAVDDMPETGLKCNVYGAGKRGKTRFSCTFPKPLLLMGTEDGTKSVKQTPGVDFVKVTTQKNLEDLTTYLREGGGSRWRETKGSLVQVDMGEGDTYKTAVLDHASGYQGITLKEVLGLKELPAQMHYGVAKMEDWMATAYCFKERLSKLLDLADKQGTHVVVIAHERDFAKGESDNDMLVPTIASDLSEANARWLNGVCDFVMNCFVKDEVKLRKTIQGVGANAKEVTEKIRTGKREYCLRIGPHPKYFTGFRSAPGIILPEVVGNPHFDKIMRLIHGEPLEDE